MRTQIVSTMYNNTINPLHNNILYPFRESIPAEFYSLFVNQTYVLAAIYNYTSLLPGLELLVQSINSSLPVTTRELEVNKVQNCSNYTEVAPIAPACPLGVQAAGKI